MTSPSAPALSVVIPSYNMASYLELSLESLRHLVGEQRATGLDFEVVVVDDGSSDGAGSVVAAAAADWPGLRVVRRERDALSCRSLARNMGVRASRGRYVVFLDAGVMVPPDFLRELARTLAAGGDDAVLVIATIGLFAWRALSDFEAVRARYRSLGREALAAALGELRRHPAWCDRREPLFDLVGGELSRLPAPWLLAWSCALGVPRRRFDEVGGFDETFLNWGSEDCDFAARLHDTGVPFRAFASAPVLHVPHPTEKIEGLRSENAVNARRLHGKRFERESELFVVLDDPHASNLFAMRLDGARLEHVLPVWGPEMLAAVTGIAEHAAAGARGATDVMILGAPTADLARSLRGAAWVVPSRPLAALVGMVPGVRSVACGLGCAMADPDGARGAVVLTDLVRVLPPPLAAAQLREALRVGRRAFLVLSDPGPGWLDETRIRRELEGWPMLSFDGLARLAADAGVGLATRADSRFGTRVFELEPRAAGGDAR